MINVNDDIRQHSELNWYIILHSQTLTLQCYEKNKSIPGLKTPC